MRFYINTIILLLLIALEVNSQSLFQPDNLDFEKSTIGAVPSSWSYSRKLEEAGMIIESSSTNPSQGKICVILHNPMIISDKAKIEETTLPVYQVLDAIPYRNKKIRLTASAKLERSQFFAKGELWAIGRSTKDSVTLSIYQDKDSITANDWKNYSIVFTVPEETNELRVGILLRGGGKLWADDFKIEILQPDGVVNEPPMMYSESQISHLYEFGKLYGYLNYFNVSTELHSSRNEMINFEAISKIEKSNNKNDIFNILQDYTLKLSPASKLSTSSNEKWLYEKPANSNDYIAYAKKYVGGPVDRSDEVFSANKVNVFASSRQREGSAVQPIEVAKFKNKLARISASIKVLQASPGANAQIWVRANRINSLEFVASTSVDNPAMSSNWKRYETKIELPSDVHFIKLALILIGEGKAYFDDVKIDILENGKKVDEIPVPNYSFETLNTNGNAPMYWLIDPEVEIAGYSVKYDSLEATKGKFSLVIESDEKGRVPFPKIGSIANIKVADNLHLYHPYLYYGSEQSALPMPSKDLLKVNGKPLGFNPNMNDRHTRVLSVIKLWNAIKHFGPEKIEAAKLDSMLKFAITKAAKDKNSDEFMQTLKSMLVFTNDARAQVWHPDIDLNYSLPFVIRDISDKIIVTAVADTSIGIKKGDELLEYDGIQIMKLVNELVEYYPGNNDKYKIAKALVELRAGAKDSSTKLKFRDKNNVVYEKEVKRNILLQNVFEKRPVAIREFDSGYVYIDLTDINDYVLKDYIEPLSERVGFVFDLRGFTSVSEHFISFLSENELKNTSWKVPVYTFPDKENILFQNFGGANLKGAKKLSGKKNVFLIDDKTSGYSEVLASIAKANNLGTFVGSATSGYASEALAFRLYGQIGVSFAGLKVIDPNGEEIFGKSLIPDIKMEYKIDGEDVIYDNFILEAMKLIKN